MKSLTKFINEQFDKYVVENVKVTFDVLPEEFFLNAPEDYSESDLQIYLGDRLLPELPSENDKYSKLLGKNDVNIADAYFEYEKFEHLQKSDNDEFNLEWDPEYDEKKKDENLDTFKLTKLKYVILFDEFELMDDESDVKETLDEIFTKFDSSNINKYPVEIKYNSELLEFNE